MRNDKRYYSKNIYNKWKKLGFYCLLFFGFKMFAQSKNTIEMPNFIVLQDEYWFNNEKFLTFKKADEETQYFFPDQTLFCTQKFSSQTNNQFSLYFPHIDLKYFNAGFDDFELFIKFLVLNGVFDDQNNADFERLKNILLKTNQIAKP